LFESNREGNRRQNRHLSVFRFRDVNRDTSKGGIIVASLRDEWKKVKETAKKAGLDAADVADKQGFGKLLDAVEEKRSAWDKEKDTEKKKTALLACQTAQKAAFDARQKYAQSFKHIEDHSTGPTKDAAKKVGVALVTILNILKNYRAMGGA